MQPRVVIAGTHSGAGKTTIAVGLMAALKEKGYDVRPFKVGPDYIDPGFHRLVTGNASYNLDTFFLGAEGVKEVFLQGFNNNSQFLPETAPDRENPEITASGDGNKERRLALIEGVMGLFDGKGKEGESSTAHIARVLKTPVVLVINAASMATSAAAVAYGFKHYDPDLRLEGVIFNNVASSGHYRLLKEAVAELGIEVLGYLPRNQDLQLPERHLGLVPTSESEDLADYLALLGELIGKHIELEKLIQLTRRAPVLKLEEQKIFQKRKQLPVKLGIARDQAFNFYYQANLDLLQQLGAELVFFSPLNDRELPAVDGVYIGGGFPESFLSRLEENETMKNSFRKKIAAGLPVYAECGGLMYLTREVVDFEGNSYRMAGVVSGRTVMTDSLQALGYVEAEAVTDNLLLAEGEVARGHEFHYSVLKDFADTRPAYRLTGGKGRDGRGEGYSRDNLLASYVHLHFGYRPRIAVELLARCRKQKLKERVE